MKTTKAATLFFLSLTAGVVGAVPCENIHPNYRNRGWGPLDYNDPIQQQRQKGSGLDLVESAHFTERVRTLKSGNTSQTPGGDLSYTLWAFPNHHQALLTLIDYTLKSNSDQPPEMIYTAECYFNRAVQWRPDDAKTRIVYGIYLYKRNKIAESITQFSEAARLDPDSGNAYYNLGLAYIKNNDYEQALKAAHTAYSLGIRLEGLKNKLASAGRWKDPAPTAASVPATEALPSGSRAENTSDHEDPTQGTADQ